MILTAWTQPKVCQVFWLVFEAAETVGIDILTRMTRTSGGAQGNIPGFSFKEMLLCY